MSIFPKKSIIETIRALERCVIGLKKRKENLEKEYGFKAGFTLTKEDRQRYYDYYNGKLYAYLWVLGAMGSTVGEEMANEMVKEIKTIDNKCMFIENHEQDSEV